MTLPMDQIEFLSKDRPLVTPEIYQSNDFYGHACLIKKYLGIHPSYSLKVAIEHGPTLSEYVWDADLNNPCPIFLCANDLAQRLYTERCSHWKKAISIGPLLYYLEKDQDVPRKVPGGKTLLVFPNHSTHHTELDFDLHHHLEVINKRAKEFDQVLVCIYWKDVLRKLHRFYAAEGYSCTMAGHMYDPRFLYRLRKIIVQSSAVISFACGTSVLYSVLLGKPTWVLPDKALSLSTNEACFKDLQRKVSMSNNSMIVHMQRLFAAPSDILPGEQVEFVRSATGYRNVKQRSELMQIVQEAEEIYCAMRHIKPSPIPLAESLPNDMDSTRLGHGHPVKHWETIQGVVQSNPSDLELSNTIALIQKAVRALDANDATSAFNAVTKAKSLKVHIKGLDCLQAMCLLRMNKTRAAKESLIAELAAFPDNVTARNLLSSLPSDINGKNA